MLSNYRDHTSFTYGSIFPGYLCTSYSNPSLVRSDPSYLLQAVGRDGLPRFKLETDRGGAKWFSKVIKVPKITSWKDEIVSFVLVVSIVYFYLLLVTMCIAVRGD